MTETEQGPSPVTGPHDGPFPSCGTTTGMRLATDTPSKVQAWSCVACGTKWVISMVNPRPFLDLLAMTVDLAAARSLLWELLRLADQVPGLTEEQLRFRLLALAERATLRSLPVPRSPAGRWSSKAPDSAPGGQPGTTRHRGPCAVNERWAADPWRDAQGAPIPVRIWVEQTDIDAELGATALAAGQAGPSAAPQRHPARGVIQGRDCADPYPAAPGAGPARGGARGWVLRAPAQCGETAAGSRQRLSNAPVVGGGENVTREVEFAQESPGASGLITSDADEVPGVFERLQAGTHVGGRGRGR